MALMRLASLLLVSALSFGCSSTASSTEPPIDASADAVGDALDASDAFDAFDAIPAEVGGDTATKPDVVADVSLPDTGTPLSAACAAAGGSFCTSFRWNICPAGFEPVSSTDHYACGTASGWCCRPAPASPCAASGQGNCLATCPIDCWQPVTDTTLTCDGARKCCRDTCK